MKSFRICIQNIRKWSSNNRIKMSFILAVLCVYIYTSGIGTLGDYMGAKSSPWLFPFLFSYRYMKIVFMAPVIFMFCDAPFVDANQVYIMLRTNRKKWCIGQMMYIWAASFLYGAVLLLSSVLVNISHIEWNTKWGEVLGAAGTTNALSKLNLQYSTVRVSSRIIKYYTPLQAMFFSFLVMWLSFVFIGMIIYVLNVLTKTKMAGSITASFLVLLTAVVDGFVGYTWISPISWNSLNNIDVGGFTEYPRITYILLVYGIVILVCMVLSIILSKKQEIIVQEER